MGIFCVPLCTIPFLGREVLRKYLPNSTEGGCLLALFVMSQAAGIPKTPYRHRRQQKNSRKSKAVSHSKHTHAVFVRSNYTKQWRVWLSLFPLHWFNEEIQDILRFPTDPDPKGQEFQTGATTLSQKAFHRHTVGINFCSWRSMRKTQMVEVVSSFVAGKIPGRGNG